MLETVIMWVVLVGVCTVTVNLPRGLIVNLKRINGETEDTGIMSKWTNCPKCGGESYNGNLCVKCLIIAREEQKERDKTSDERRYGTKKRKPKK